MEGCELRELIAQHGAVSELQARTMAKQLLEAIAYLQLIGVAHRCARLATPLFPINFVLARILDWLPRGLQ